MESNNLALKGVVGCTTRRATTLSRRPPSIARCWTRPRRRKPSGRKGHLPPVDKFGMVNPEDVRNAITDKTIPISVMFANNEIGTINPIKEIGKIAKEKGILFHCDATQGVGKVPINVQEMASISCRLAPTRFYGPKGIGALLSVRKRIPSVSRLKWMLGWT